MITGALRFLFSNLLLIGKGDVFIPA